MKNTLLVFCAICLGALTLTAAVPTRPNGTSGPYASVPAGWPSLGTDQVAVGTSAVALGDSTDIIVGCVIVKADDDNSDTVYIGGSDAVTTSTGYHLEAGQTTPYIPAETLAELFAIGGAASQKVSILYGKP